MRTIYFITTKEGGLMEDPEIRCTNGENIIADTPEEAEEIYNKRNSCYYFYGDVDYIVGKTTDDKTDSKPLLTQKELDRLEWIGR